VAAPIALSFLTSALRPIFAVLKTRLNVSSGSEVACYDSPILPVANRQETAANRPSTIANDLSPWRSRVRTFGPQSDIPCASVRGPDAAYTVIHDQQSIPTLSDIPGVTIKNGSAADTVFRSIARQWSRFSVSTAWAGSRNHFDFARLPGLVEERWQWAVEPQDGEPALIRVGLDPVAADDAFGLFRPEIDRG